MRNTIDRPVSYSVPSTEAIAIANELSTLGGGSSEVAFAPCSTIPAFDDVRTAIQLVSWLSNGFSTTTLATDYADAGNLLLHVVARFESTLKLSIQWTHITEHSALNCLGESLVPERNKNVSPSTNAAVAFEHISELQTLLETAFSQKSTDSFYSIFTLRVYHPGKRSLACLNVILADAACLSSSPLVGLLEEIVELHARQRAGEHTLRSIHTHLVNRLAAKLLQGGDSWLLLPADVLPNGLAQRAAVCIQAVCRRKTASSDILRSWIPSVKEFLRILGMKKRGVAQNTTSAAAQQRSRKLASLASTRSNRSETLGALPSRLPEQQSIQINPPAKDLSPFSTLSLTESFQRRLETLLHHQQGTGTNDARRSMLFSPGLGHAPANPVEIRGGAKATNQLRLSDKSIPVTRGVSDMTSPSAAVCYGSPSQIGQHQPSPVPHDAGALTTYAAAFYKNGNDGISPQQAFLRATGSTLPPAPTEDVFTFDIPPPVAHPRVQQLDQGDEVEYVVSGISNGKPRDEPSLNPMSAAAMLPGTPGDDCSVYDGEIQNQYKDGDESGSCLGDIDEKGKRALLVKQPETTQAVCCLPVAQDGPQQRPGLQNTKTEESVALSEPQLAMEVEILSLQRDVVVLRARCRALERESSLSTAFQKSEAAVKRAELEAENLRKENADLSRALAEAQLKALVNQQQHGSVIKPPLTDSGNTSDSSNHEHYVISALHRKLQKAQNHISTLHEQLESSKQAILKKEKELRMSEIHKKAAESAQSKLAALSEQLSRLEGEKREQSLLAAEGWGLVEQLKHERDETMGALELERNKSEEAVRLAGAMRDRLGALMVVNGYSAVECLFEG